MFIPGNEKDNRGEVHHGFLYTVRSNAFGAYRVTSVDLKTITSPKEDIKPYVSCSVFM